MRKTLSVHILEVMGSKLDHVENVVGDSVDVKNPDMIILIITFRSAASYVVNPQSIFRGPKDCVSVPSTRTPSSF